SARLMSRLPVSGMVTVRPENLKLVYLAGTAYSKRAGWLGFAKHHPAKYAKCYHARMPGRSRGRIHRQAINAPGHAHELTFSCYQRFPFLKAERTCQWLADAIAAARVKHSFDL